MAAIKALVAAISSRFHATAVDWDRGAIRPDVVPVAGDRYGHQFEGRTDFGFSPVIIVVRRFVDTTCKTLRQLGATHIHPG